MIGTLMRYGLAGLVHKLLGYNSAWGTLTVNIVGCFLAGIVWALFEHRWSVPSETKALVIIGFLGAFTTFSTFILETTEFLQAAEWLKAVGNILLQNGCGVAALIAGNILGRMI